MCGTVKPTLYSCLYLGFEVSNDSLRHYYYWWPNNTVLMSERILIPGYGQVLAPAGWQPTYLSTVNSKLSTVNIKQNNKKGGGTEFHRAKIMSSNNRSNKRASSLSSKDYALDDDFEDDTKPPAKPSKKKAKTKKSDDNVEVSINTTPLPLDALLMVMEFLHPRDLLNTASTCKW